MIRGADLVIGHHGNLSASARRVHDKLRNRVTGGVAAQTFHDLDAFCDRRAEMSRAFDQIALIEIIRADTDARQLLDQFALDVNTIIDPGQKNGLIAQRNSGAAHAVTSLGQFLRDLIRMVDMNVQPQRMEPTEHIT